MSLGKVRDVDVDSQPTLQFIDIPLEWISDRAYQKWLVRGRHGHDQKDWLEAEMDIKEELEENGLLVRIREHDNSEGRSCLEVCCSNMQEVGPEDRLRLWEEFSQGVMPHCVVATEILPDEVMEPQEECWSTEGDSGPVILTVTQDDTRDEGVKPYEMDLSAGNGKEPDVMSNKEISASQREAGEQDEYGNLWFHDPAVLSELDEQGFEELCAGFSVVLVESKSDRLFVAVNDEETIQEEFINRDLKPSQFQFSPGPVASETFGQFERSPPGLS